MLGLGNVLAPLSSVGNPLDVIVEVRIVSRGSNLVGVLLDVLSVDLLQHVIIQRLIRIDEDRKKSVSAEIMIILFRCPGLYFISRNDKLMTFN